MVQIQTLAVCWLPLLLLLCDRMILERRKGDTLYVSVALAFTLYCSMYIGIFSVILLGSWTVAGGLSRRYPLRWPTLARLTAAVGLAVLFTTTLWLEYLSFSAAYGFHHDKKELINRSAALLDLIQSPEWELIWGRTMLRQQFGHRGAFPGIVVTALVFLALFSWGKLKREYPAVRIALLAAVLCYSLAFGPVLKVHPSPAHIFGHEIPWIGAIVGVIPGIRVPYRFLVCASLFVGLIAGTSVAMLGRRFQHGKLITTAILILMVIDVAPSRSSVRASRNLPPPLAVSDAYPFLAAHSAEDAVAIELPVSLQDGYQPPVQARYVYGASGHLHRVVSYHAAVLPPQIRALQNAALLLPSEPSRQTLLKGGVTRLVLHRTDMDAAEFERRAFELDRTSYFREFTGKEAYVYRLDKTSNRSFRDQK